jgi:hypothetical protein
MLLLLALSTTIVRPTLEFTSPIDRLQRLRGGNTKATRSAPLILPILVLRGGADRPRYFVNRLIVGPPQDLDDRKRMTEVDRTKVETIVRYAQWAILVVTPAALWPSIRETARRFVLAKANECAVLRFAEALFLTISPLVLAHDFMVMVVLYCIRKWRPLEYGALAKMKPEALPEWHIHHLFAPGTVYLTGSINAWAQAGCADNSFLSFVYGMFAAKFAYGHSSVRRRVVGGQKASACKV